MGAAPAGGMGGFIPTEAPQAAAPGAPAGAAAPANFWSAPGGAVNPFGSPTMIGGDISAGGKVDPVVGWLVCVEGPLRGTGWHLHAGYNYIGREVGDIHIQGDSQISREKHATVAYYKMSDGVYNALTRAELAACLNAPAEEAVILLDQAIRAKNYANQDNYTAVILSF